MCKKITTMLAMATAVMLSLPVGAQPVAKRGGVLMSREMKGISSTTKAKAEVKEKILTLSRQHKNVNARGGAKSLAKLSAGKTEKGVKVPFRADRTASFKPETFYNNLSMPMRIRKASGETVDEHGIIVAPPEGERQVFRRSGWTFDNDDNMAVLEQTGTVQIVTCDDETVYIRNILSRYPTGAWVKGTLEGNTIVVPTRQPIYYNANGECTFSIRWGYKDEGAFFSEYSSYGDNFVFSFDEENATLTLQGSSDAIFMGLFWDDDDAFAWQGDYQTVWTYESDYEPLPVVTVEPPASLSTAMWFTHGHEVAASAQQHFKSQVAVGFDGNDVYLKGIFADYPEAWMKGTIEGDRVTFAGLQQQGDGAYAVGMDSGDLTAFTMTYDAEAQQLSSDMSLLLNGSETDVAAIVQYSDITIQIDDPYKPIETLPYENTFGQEGFEWFSVIDANGDDFTWKLEDDMAVYSFNGESSADDWLVSPAFVLEAGKHYNVAIDAFCSSAAFYERIEVMLGSEATAEAMTQTVIEPTDVDWETAQTLQNLIVSVPTSGIYYFGIHAISDADKASLKVSRFAVDETIVDAPEAVSDLTASPNVETKTIDISFTAPTKNLGGGDLTENITLDLLRDDNVVKTFSDVAPGTPITYTDNDPELVAGTYTYQVVASNSFGQGGKSQQLMVHLSDVYDIPYVANFSEDGTYEQFSTINANDDGKYWENNINYAAYEYDSTNDADDYLVSPALRMEAGKRYNIIVRAEAGGEYVERFEVKVGKQPTVEGLTDTAIEPTELTGTEPIGGIDVEGIYECTESGIYHVAVHCISDADMYMLMIYRLTVEAAPELTAPAAPELAVTPDATGQKKAEVIITAPTLDNEGNALTANLTKIELLRDGSVINEFEDVAPGATLSYTDEDITENGNFTYQAIPYNADGVGTKSAPVSVYVGFDIPDQVQNMAVTDQTSSVLFTWDKVTTGRNGGIVNPAEIDYILYECEFNSTLFNDTPIATVHDADSYELQQPTNEGEQGFQLWYMAARNEAGESYLNDDPVMLIVGKPYDLPFVEGWSGDSHYWDTNSTALSYMLSSDDDGVAVALTAQEPDTDIFLTSGKINISDAANPTLLVDLAGAGVTSVDIIGRVENSDEAEMLGTFAVGEDYQTVKVPLNSLKGGRFISFAIMAHIDNATYYDYWEDQMVYGDALIVDNIRVIDQHANDLGVELIAAEELQAGKAMNVMATVINWGEQPAAGFTLTVKAGDEVLLEQIVDDALAAYAKQNFTARLETTVFTPSGDMPLAATISYTADENALNDEALTSVNITEPIAPAPENLVAENAEGVDLSWEAPTATVQYTEGFEDGFGGWITIDADGDSFNWICHNNGDDNIFMATNSGLGSCFSESYSNDAERALTPDNWLVSPQLILDGTFSFYAMGQDEDYSDEHFAVYVSTGDPTDPASFTQVTDEMVTTSDMVEYTVDLSEYAGQKGYVAIRHFNVTDQYVIVIDDVTYTMGGQPAVYNVYYEGNLVDTVKGDQTTYTLPFEGLSSGEHTFAVTAVYANGQESAPVTTTLDVVDTGISQLITDGQPFDVYTLDGKLVRRQATTLSGLHGIYVVRSAGLDQKSHVRVN